MAFKHPIYVILIATLVVGCSQNGDRKLSLREDTLSTALVEPSLEHPEVNDGEKASIGIPTRYKVKDGKIVYRYEGLQSGTETVYWTNYGMTEIKYTETERENPFQGAQEAINLITLMHDSNIYVVDRSTMNARKLDNTLLYESAEDSPTLDLNEVAENIYRSKGGKVVDTNIIAGVPAVKWQIDEVQTTEWRWKGIMMKTMIQLPRNYVKIEATEVDTSSALPENIFQLPTEVNLMEGMSMKQWMEDLSKPIQHKNVVDIRDSNRIKEAGEN